MSVTQDPGGVMSDDESEEEDRGGGVMATMLRSCRLSLSGTSTECCFAFGASWTW